MVGRDEWVDAIVDELEKLYAKDTDHRKALLGKDYIRTIFDHYSNWIAKNQNLNAIQVARSIFKDLKSIGYYDYQNQKLNAKGQHQDSYFDLIYGSIKEINEAYAQLTKLKATNPKKYNLVVSCLEMIKGISDKSAMTKFSGAKLVKAGIIKSPTFSTFSMLMKMNEKQLMNSLQKWKKV